MYFPKKSVINYHLIRPLQALSKLSGGNPEHVDGRPFPPARGGWKAKHGWFEGRHESMKRDYVSPALRAKATILLHRLIKFRNWIRCLLSVRGQILISSQRGLQGQVAVQTVACVGERWRGNMKIWQFMEFLVLFFFNLTVELSYGFYRSLSAHFMMEGPFAITFLLSDHLKGVVHSVFKFCPVCYSGEKKDCLIRKTKKNNKKTPKHYHAFLIELWNNTDETICVVGSFE